MRLLAFLAACSIILTGVALAGPVEPGDISQDAKWFGHINVQAIHSMEIVQDLRAKIDKDGRLKDRMREVSEKIGMNPMEDLLAVTVYATQYEGDYGVGLFYVKNVDSKKLLAVLKEKHPSHEAGHHGDRALYSWTVKHRRGEMKLTSAFASKKLIVIGADEDHVKAALDVLDGKKHGMSADSPLMAGASKNSLLVSNALDVPEGYQGKTKCPVLKRCSAVSVNWTEKKGAIKAKYVFTTDSAETASGFKGMIDAAMTMGEMRVGKMDGVKKLMAGLKYKAKGEVFTLTWKTTTDDIQAAVKQAMERWRK